jgi:hypothetical protein
MKLKVLFILSFTIMILVTVIAVFFLNKFLFLIHGYSMNLTESTSAQAFEAYKTIYKTKVLLIVVSLVISIILLVVARKSTLQNPIFSYKIIYGISWLMTIIFSILCALFIILPKGPLV